MGSALGEPTQSGATTINQAKEHQSTRVHSGKASKVPQLFRGLSSRFLATLLLFMTLQMATAKKVNLAFSSVGFDGQSDVSLQTKLHFDLTKVSDGTPWQIKQCYEISFSNDYTPQASQAVDSDGNIIRLYYPFDDQKPPVCTAEGDFNMTCSLKEGTRDILRFHFTKFEPGAESKPKIDFQISNF